MNLVVDIGNSSSKAALFKGSALASMVRSDSFSPDMIESLILKRSIDAIIVSSVSNRDKEIRAILSKFSVPVIILSSSIPLPFRIDYSSPETLGSDRIAGVAGAHNKFAGNNVLIIDSGTAITYDLLLSDNTWPGGNISPGLKTRFKALNQFTGRLPLVEPGKLSTDLGIDTGSAIKAGVQLGLIFEINEYIRTFKNRYKNLEVIITGGDSEFLKDYINFSFTFAPELVMEGLNHILNYNVKVF